MNDRWFPEKLVAHTMGHGGNTVSLRFVEETFRAASAPLCFAEVGVWKGATSRRLAEILNSRGSLHLFDYHDTVSAVQGALAARGLQTSSHGAARTNFSTATIGI